MISKFTHAVLNKFVEVFLQLDYTLKRVFNGLFDYESQF